MIFRKATVNDVPQVMRIINDAISRMLNEGKCQWSRNYPAPEHILADIQNDCAYVLSDGPDVLAYGAVITDGEPAYEILEGEWLSDGQSVVVHRLAVSMAEQSRGNGARFMKAVEHFAASQGIGSFKVDTNFDNDRMLHLLDKLGFERCGIIQYPQGERIAFEKLI